MSDSSEGRSEGEVHSEVADGGEMAIKNIESEHRNLQEDRNDQESNNKEKEMSEHLHTKIRNGLVEAGVGYDHVEDRCDKYQWNDTAVEQHATIREERPTYIKVNLKHLLPETLNHYNLPWEYDRDHKDYVLIKQYISHEFQDELFAHTRRLKQSTWRSPRSVPESILDLSRVYVPPKNDLGVDLNWEVDDTAASIILERDPSAKGTTKVNGKRHLESRLNTQSSLEFSILSAHRCEDQEDTFGTAVEYFDSGKHSNQSHFRWTHVQVPTFDPRESQSFISQVSDLDEEERSLMTALINDVGISDDADLTSLFRLRRADARRKDGESKPTKWAIFLTMLSLGTPTYPYQDGADIPFIRYQYPSELFHKYNQRTRLNSTYPFPPIGDASLLRLSAFLLSSGTLVTFSPETFSNLCQSSLSMTKLDTSKMMRITSKVRLHDPDGAIFLFPLSLCETFFDLMRAVLTMCKKKFGDNFYSYALLDKHGQRIGSADWLRFLSTHTDALIELWVRMLSVRPQPKTRRVTVPGPKSEALLNDRNVADDEESDISSEASLGSVIDIDAILRGDYSTANTRYRETSDVEDYRAPRRERYTLPLVRPRPQDWDYAVAELPPHRTPRFLVVPTNNKIVNLNARNVQGLFFDRSELSDMDEVIDRGVTSTSKAESPNGQSGSTPMKTENILSAFAQVQPFFSWPTKDNEHSRSEENMGIVLNEVDAFLRRRRIDIHGQSVSIAHSAKLYRALEKPDEFEQLNEVIATGMSSHPRIKPLQTMLPMHSWQDLLFELIRRSDIIMSAFCPPDNEHVVIQKFRYARASLFKNFIDLCELQFTFNSVTASKDHPEDDSGEGPYYIFDYAEIVDDRLTKPPSPDFPVHNCLDCQQWRGEWPSFDTHKAAMGHLYLRHFKVGKPSAQVQRYIVPAKHLNSVVVCMEAGRLMMAVLLHFGAAIKLIDEIKQGVAGSTRPTFPYRLTKSLVRVFQEFLSIMIEAVKVNKYAKSKFASTSSTTKWMQLHLRPGIDVFSTYGGTLEFALSNARKDLIMQSHTDMYTTADPYELVDSPYVLISLLASLTARVDTSNPQGFLRTYADVCDRMCIEVRHRPGKRLYREINQNVEEVEAIEIFLRQQLDLITSLRNVLRPGSFQVTTIRRQRQYQLERNTVDQLIDRLRGQAKMFSILRCALEDIHKENMRAGAFWPSDDLHLMRFVLMGVAMSIPALSFVISLPASAINAISTNEFSRLTFEPLSLPIGVLSILLVLATIIFMRVRRNKATKIPRQTVSSVAAQETTRKPARRYGRWRSHDLKVQRDLSEIAWRGTSHQILIRHMLRKYRRYNDSDSDD